MTTPQTVDPAPETDPTSAMAGVTLWASGRSGTPSPWAAYATEVLAHAGIAHTTSSDPRGVVLVTTPVTADDAARLASFVADGGALVLATAPGALAALAGVEEGATVRTAQVEIVPDDAWTHLPPRPLRAVGGVELTPAPSTRTLATWPGGAAAVTVHTHGDGVVLTFGADLLQSVVRIQQGYAVTADGAPASDGTAPIDDDILKAEDGMALDLETDRALPPREGPVPANYTHTYPPPSAVPMFDTPHADWWRSLLLQATWFAAERSGSVVPWLGYWPAGLSAIAHMSHDSDGNSPEDGRAALDAFADADVQVTWCQVFPGGYGPEIYEEITAAGHEHALHYNAMHDADLASWGWPQIRAQYAWAQAVTGREHIVSNKNHYTRWEGWTEFYTWCERLGIEIDESRGPSKQGTVGFPFGTAHVSFPLAEDGSERTFHDVLNLPLHTQDLAWAGHASIRDVILDGAQEQHGVAHFLFHGPHLNIRPLTRAACLELADEARRRGMEWWTAERINAWERARRGVSVEVVADGEELVLRVSSDASVAGAAILLPPGVSVAGPPHALTGVTRHGRKFTELAADLPAGTTTWTLAR
ncbi:polysaccharide deacetylase family protein [Krasilnikoviella flava]|uniref:Polysaccharide deacetylase n=1 Tax=Krasilnikoviella flava TaxID=526729 RepID=A0A1T5LAN4_9MICO|nr:hypothetical protein [Krasilnikoviella flava]SKC72745.1 hypothetical protein SAMN04324258_3210 [Krasilnikoviella flava]